MVWSPPISAQTLGGLSLGEPLVPALGRMPRTHDFAPVGNDVAIKWQLPDGNTLSATAWADTRKILFVEEDRRPAAANATPLPGLTLGATTLADLRRRFGSNGMGFASNGETMQAGRPTGVNCFELRHAPGVFVAFVTQLSPADTTPPIDTGKGMLVAIIVARKTYLQEIWGETLLRDLAYRPILLPGLVAGD